MTDEKKTHLLAYLANYYETGEEYAEKVMGLLQDWIEDGVALLGTDTLKIIPDHNLEPGTIELRIAQTKEPEKK